MDNDIRNNKSLYIEDEIDLKELLYALFQGKWLILFTILLFSIGGIVYSLSLPNIYKSHALLYPTEQQTDIGGAMKAYSGLAGMAGINFSSQSAESNAVKALEKVNSFSFFKENLLPNIFLPNLMAVDSWDKNTSSIKYDTNIFDESKNSWTRKVSYPKILIPSAQESFEVFKGHINVFQEKDSGFVTISVKHESPLIAQKWTLLIVDQLNNYFRTKDKKEAEIAVSYLKNQIAQTSYTEIKQVIAQLMQSRTQQLTLIEVSKYYVFDYIDPPIVMEKKSEPKRSVICILAAFYGLISGMVLVIFRYLISNKS
jgi:uncharacterized protein involved in exopolysaccharide biosynthesis